MMRFSLLLACSLSLYGATPDVHITFSQQGAETLRATSGQVPPGLGIVAVVACVAPDGPATVVPSGRIYQAAAALKIAAISPELAAPILDRQKGRSKIGLGIDIGSGASGVAGILGTTKSIKMKPGIAAGLSLVPLVVDLVKAFLTKRLPNDNPVRVGLLNGDVGIPAGGCAARLILDRYHGDWDPRETAVNVTAPAPAVQTVPAKPATASVAVPVPLGMLNAGWDAGTPVAPVSVPATRAVDDDEEWRDIG
jgi:hypothetical protein